MISVNFTVNSDSFCSTYHGSLDIPNVELILKTDRKTMKRPLWYLVLHKIFVEVTSIPYSGVKENLVQAIGLYAGKPSTYELMKEYIRAGVPVQRDGKMLSSLPQLSNCRCLLL